MSNIYGVIFSRDRAMQLDAMLRSLFLHCQDIEKVNVWIIYKTTNERHSKQYQELAQEYSGRAFFQRQRSFRKDILTYLNPFERKSLNAFAFSFLSELGKFGVPLGSFLDRICRRMVTPVLTFVSKRLFAKISKDSLLLFLVDDNIFVQDFYFKEAIKILQQEQKAFGFSLRLGKNTTYCYAKEHKQLLPEWESQVNSTVFWNWTKADGDFGYPLEVSSSIYRLQDILPLLLAISYDNPNTLEDRMSFHARMFRKLRPLLTCYERSVTFCNPVNMVQSVIPNRAGGSKSYQVDELASKFERGERIKVEAFSGFIPQACHQEVDLIFEKRGM